MKTRPVLVVSERDATVADLLPRLGEDAPRALEEGRIFVGKRRALLPADPVSAGDEVHMYPSRVASSEPPRVLFESAGVVAAYKPAAMATIADHHGAVGTLVQKVAELLGSKAPTLVPTSRLDVGVSGVVLFATNEAARHELARARQEGRYRRHYVAISQQAPVPARGVWSGTIGRARDPRHRAVGGRDAVPAETTYALAEIAPRAALLAIEPVTGRTHQIRVHSAHASCPLLGDAAYGGLTRLVAESGAVRPIERIALHAAWVDVPFSGSKPIHVEADVPDDLRVIWASCGGAPAAWSLACVPLDAR